MILRPYLLDGFRNQNSIILAKRVFFVEGSTIDVTEHVIRLAGIAPLALSCPPFSAKGRESRRV